MKKIYVLILLIIAGLFLTSCESDQAYLKAPESKRLELDTLSQYSDQKYRIYTLEGCEYVVVGYGKERWGSHKGDCKNPIHNK